MNQPRQFEVKMFGAGALLGHAGNAATELKISMIQRVSRHDARPHRAGAVETLALIPLATVATLNIAPGHVIDDGVAEDVIHCVCF